VPDIRPLLTSHDERRGALILVGKRIRQLTFGRRNDPVLKVLRQGASRRTPGACPFQTEIRDLKRPGAGRFHEKFPTDSVA